MADDDKFEELLRDAVRSPQVVGPRHAGTIIAERYRLDRHLAQGGMGSIWAATHTVTLRQFALKFMIGTHERWDELKERFRREARAACAVQHPGVLPVQDIFETDTGELVMVMDLLEGENLGVRLGRDGALGPGVTSAILSPVFEATRAAHAAGVLHRDLKPDNIFLCDDGQIRVLDFGLARVATQLLPGSMQDALTMPGTTVGTPAHMAPEQAIGEELDHRADIWSLGTVLYQCLSGSYAVEAETVTDAVNIIFGTGITPLAETAPGVPSKLAALVDRMLQVDPNERLDDLREAQDILARYHG